jgi:hypothetical protein
MFLYVLRKRATTIMRTVVDNNQVTVECSPIIVVCILAMMVEYNSMVVCSMNMTMECNPMMVVCS